MSFPLYVFAKNHLIAISKHYASNYGSFCLVLVLMVHLFIQPLAKAASRDVEDLQLWTRTRVDFHIHDKFYGMMSETVRNNENVSGLQKILIRSGLGYKLTAKLTLWAGHVWSPSFEPYKNENRIWEEADYLIPLKPGDLTLTSRLEQKFTAGAASTTNWIRPKITFTHNFKNHPTLFWSTWQELFINLNNVHQASQVGITTTRSYIGLGKRLNKHMKLEAGYMLQGYNLSEYKKHNELDHVLFVTLSFK